MKRAINSRNLAFLPEINELKKRCISLVILDQILFSFQNPSVTSFWLENNTFMYDEFSGKRMSIYFDKRGAIIKGFDKSALTYTFSDDQKIWPNLLNGVPERYKFFLEQDYCNYNKIYTTTFCIWRDYNDTEWRISKEIIFPEIDYDLIDGSEDLLPILIMNHVEFSEWSEEQYELDNIDINSVKEIYDFKTITTELINKLNQNLTNTEVENIKLIVKELNYPVE